MRSIQSKNITPNNSNHSPFFQKGNNGFFPVKNNKPFFKASPIQTKLTIGQPNDPDSYRDEKEADSMADKVVQRLNDKSFSGSENNSNHFFSKPSSFVQRKCATCEQEEKLQKKEEVDEKDMLQNKLQKKPIFESNTEHPPDDEKNIQRKCTECEEEKLQKKSEPSSQTAPSNIESNLNSSGSSGNLLPAATREQMESSFGADFSGVKIHNDSTSVQMNESLNAQAFTHGSDIYFNAGKYNTNNTAGRHLLAHELTHVVQQNEGKNIQKQDEAVPANSSAGNTQGIFLTDDSALPAEGQMNKSDFLQRLNAEVCQTVDEALRFTGSSSDNCPYIREVFARYQNNTPAQIEAVLRRYEPLTQFAKSADDLIQMIKTHAFTAAVQWAANGVLPGLPENISDQISSGISSVSNAISVVTTGISNTVSSISSGINSAVSDIGSLFFKSKPEGSHATQSPLGVMQSLGKGNSMSSGTKGRMETAFGTNFSDVQIHTDSKASGLSNSMNARAFTVGNHIAFGSGEHKPGTLVGDALMAHELAHVIQQSGEKNRKTEMKSDANHTGLEKDANMATIGAMLSTRKSGKNILRKMGEEIRPKMKSGLSITSCKKNVPHTPCSTAETASIDSYRTRSSGWIDAALIKLRQTPVRADVLASLQRNFGSTLGVEANLPGIIEKVVTAQTQMNGSAYYCAGTEDSTCAAGHCGYTYAGTNEFLICRNSTLASTDPEFQSYCPIHEAYHAAFSSFDVDSYSGWNGHWNASSDYPGSDPLHNADSYTTIIYDLK